jgi:hypothetical protein
MNEPRADLPVAAATTPRRAATWLLLALALMPMVPWLVDLPRFGALQYNDYYGNTAQVLDHGTFTVDPLRWLSIKSNEHTVTLPTLLYALNYLVTAGDNRGLSLVSVLLGGVCALLAGAMVARTWRLGALGRAAVTFVAAALWFTPAVAHSYVMGFSGGIWILANTFAVAAMWALMRVDGADRAWRMVPVVLVGALGAITYTTNMSLWPALLLGAWAARLGWRKVGVLALGTALVFTMQWWLRTRPANHPAPNLDGTSLLSFLGAYLGWPLTGGVDSGRWLGLAGVAVLLVGSVLALAGRDRALARRAAPFLMLGVYGFANALGTAVGRSGWGLEAARASRYVSLGMAFWLGVLGLCWWGATLLRQRLAAARPAFATRGWQRVPIALAVGLALLAALGTWHHGRTVKRSYLDQAAWHPVAAIALRHGVLADHEVLAKVNNAVDQFAAVPWLETMQHVPFERPRPLRHRVVVDRALLRNEADPRLVGACDTLLPIADGVARVQAWAVAPAGHIAEALLLDQHGVVRGELALGSPRDDVFRKVNPAWRYSGVRGYAFDVQADDRLRIWVRLVGDRVYHPLPGQVDGARVASR